MLELSLNPDFKGIFPSKQDMPITSRNPMQVLPLLKELRCLSKNEGTGYFDKWGMEFMKAPSQTLLEGSLLQIKAKWTESRFSASGSLPTITQRISVFCNKKRTQHRFIFCPFFLRISWRVMDILLSSHTCELMQMVGIVKSTWLACQLELR